MNLMRGVFRTEENLPAVADLANLCVYRLAISGKRHPLTHTKEMALVARLSLAGAGETDPEDFFSGALGVIFPDDVTNRT